MLNATIARTILNNLISSSGDTISFIGKIYLALLTKLPNDNGAAYEDGTYFAEPADEAYMRIRLDEESRITFEPILGGAQDGETIEVGEDKAIPAFVQNDALIMFPESTAAYTVAGFGLFRSNTIDTTTLPFLWGPVVDGDGNETTIEVAEGEVPVIRPEGFRVYFV